MSESSGRKGALAAFAAFFIWGLAPLYWKLTQGVPALETVAHRVVWSLLMLAAMMPLAGGFQVLARLRREPRLVGVLMLTTSLTAVNWLLFVWAIVNGQVLESSLGYFIAPLINVLLARLFLRERLTAWQGLAVALACAGVAWRMWQAGHVPWVALSLALTFSVYGLLRKQAPVGALDGLFVETLFAAPFALGWLLYLGGQGIGHFGAGGRDLALIGTGLITAIPLLLYAIGARRLRYTTLGFVQYIGPSLQFGLAVFVFGEAFDRVTLLGFAFIWAGLAVFSLDALRRARSAR